MELILTNSQETAITEFKRFIYKGTEREFLLTGSSGVGKTTLIKWFIDALDKHNAMVDTKVAEGKLTDVFLLAPTHKAKGILAEKTGLQTHTIHSALQLKMYFDKETGDQKFFKPKDVNNLIPDNTLVIVDEASMLDDFLLKEIQKGVPTGCKIVYLGDEFQLNPVGYETTPAFNQGVKPVELTELTRANNPELAQLVVTLRNAVAFNTIPKIKKGNHIKLLDKAHFEKEMIGAFKNNEDAKVIAWRNKTVKDYNSIIHKSLSGSDDFFVGQQVIVNKSFRSNITALLNVEQQLTIHEIAGTDSKEINGELLEFTKLVIDDDGTFIRVPSSKYKLNKALKQFKTHKDWGSFYRYKEMFADINDAYAITTHKCQGSSYSKVFVNLADIMRNPKRNEMLRLLYVACTRASDELILCKE